jgi:hypothetical protein
LNWARGGQSDAVKTDFDKALAIARKQEAGLFERRARTDLDRWLLSSSPEDVIAGVRGEDPSCCRAC